MRWIFLLVIVFITGCVPLQPSSPSDFIYDNITIEIQPTKDSNLNVELDILKNKLDHYKICRKDRINIVTNPTVVISIWAWTRNAVFDFHNDYRTLFDQNRYDRHLIVYISVLPGIYIEKGDGSIMGVTYNRDHIALFHNFKSYVLLHEFGHIIGLVDRSNREGDPINPDRPRHCNNKNCVMFWQVNISGEFDILCVRDIDNLRK